MVTSGSTSSGIELSNFRKYFFRKLPSSILEEVVPEDTSRSTSSGIELSNFRKSNILIPELLPPVVKISFGNSFLLFIFSKNYPENAKNTDKCVPPTKQEEQRLTQLQIRNNCFTGPPNLQIRNNYFTRPPNLQSFLRKDSNSKNMKNEGCR